MIRGNDMSCFFTSSISIAIWTVSAPKARDASRRG